MNCKNCDTSLDERINFCPFCGSKIIKKRLTLKSIWADINEQFFNIDNKLFKTFIHLFTKPEAVINGFINGTRKKYINVIQYFAISLTFIGLQVFLMTTYFSDVMVTDMPFLDTNSSSEEVKNMLESQQKGFDIVSKYQNLIYIVGVPIAALSTWLSYFVILRNKTFNYTEHIVINLYYSSQLIFITATIQILFLILGLNFYIISSIITLLSIVYFFYIFKKSYNQTFLQTTASMLLTFVAFSILIGGLVGVGILIGIIFIKLFH